MHSAAQGCVCNHCLQNCPPPNGSFSRPQAARWSYPAPYTPCHRYPPQSFPTFRSSPALIRDLG